jgi:hypothetical protein
MPTPKERKLLGCLELVSFPQFGVGEVVAKIDTGAYSGALHATHINEVTTGQGIKALEFYPLGKKSLKTAVIQYRQKPITSSNGVVEMRYVISTTILISGVTYPLLISLSDRTAMKRPVLIGRQFLHRHGFLVDVRRGNQYRYPVKENK